MPDKIRINCPQCGKTLAVQSAQLGRTGQCPACKTRITIEVPAASKPKPESAQPVTPPRPRQAPNRPAAVPDPELAHQPSHGEEFLQDKRRILAAVSAAPDKYALIEPYLMQYEQPVAIAVQRQFPFSVFADIVLLSTHRLIAFKRFFTKMNMFDVNYVDLHNVTVTQGFFTSTLTIMTSSGRVRSVPRLVTEQALNVYRLCQDIETKARIARRQFQLEENRSRTAQMQVNNLIAGPESLHRPQSPQTPLLSNRDIAAVGDEESNPYRVGE